MKQISIWGVLCTLSLMPIPTHAAPGAFSVADSIRMRRFNTQSVTGQPAPTIVNDSPNHAFGLVLTSRGLIESNEIQSTISLLDYRKLQNAFDRPTAASESLPVPIATVTAIPRIDARGAGVYGSVIFNVRWSADSKRIYFLGETSNGGRQLYTVSVATRIVRPLTPRNLDVESFDIVLDTVVYRASAVSDEDDQSMPGLPAGPNISVVTGLPITDIMGNEGTQRLRQYDLWRLCQGTNELVLKVPRSVQASSVFLSRPLSLSPGSRFAIMVSQVKAIPSSWEAFETPRQFSTLKLDHRDLWPTSPYNNVNPLREYVLVDLHRHAEEKLGAVDAGYFAFPGSPDVEWSGNGKKVLITNVFISPQGQVSNPAETIHPCAAATFDLERRTSSCLELGGNARSTPVHTNLLSASINADGDIVTLRYGVVGEIPLFQEVYHLAGERWINVGHSSVSSPESFRAKGQSIVVIVKEKLNERPTLWARDLNTGREMMIWDPNPELERVELGEASTYEWTDRFGRVWSGGLFFPASYVKGHRYPLVIQTHGFTPTRFVVDGAYPTAMAARALASVGIVVLQVGGGGDPAHTGTSAEASDNVEAYDAAIHALDKAGVINPDKVGIVGFSRTCWYVENALITMPHKFAAAIMADGVSYSFMQYHLFGSGDSFTQADAEQVIGTSPFGSGLQAWLKIAPDFRADQITAPLRIEAIRPISILNEWELYSSLAMRKKPVDLIYYREGQHVLQKPLERLVSEQGNVDWFRFWLEGQEDSDPHKHSQYLRWRQMRESEEGDTRGH